MIIHGLCTCVNAIGRDLPVIQNKMLHDIKLVCL